ncbi:NAD(P)/FAD-dependent oxidoreductase [Roseovarius amoyensis]|uniref:NAD(P)/FAD-dependent oxidoreductase n=1 Tax=Roseovarius amoyensis TaxID=2211448 RepID=UPI000DBE849D|nr:FAD-binding oxidoreductase [Roseovarius amoyensis]
MPYEPMNDDSAMPRTAYMPDAPPFLTEGKFSGSDKVDVVVIGGGLTGVTAAYHASRAGAKVRLLEANGVGWGASGRNFGQITPYLRREPAEVCSILGCEAGERLISGAAEGPDQMFDLIREHNIDCEATMTGLIYAAHTRKAMAKLADRRDFWRARGADLQILGPEAARKRIGGGNYVGAALDPRGGTVNPLRYCRGLARVSQDIGVGINGQSRVTGIEQHGNGWRVRTECGDVRADKVLSCTDSYGGSLWPQLKRAMINLRGYQLAGRPEKPDLLKDVLPGGQSMTDSSKLMSGVRKVLGGQLLVSATVAVAGAERAISTRRATARIEDLFPALGRIRWEMTWSGIVGMTWDELPRVIEPEPGLLIGYGFSGRGVALSGVMGRELAHRAAGESTHDPVFPGQRGRDYPHIPSAHAAATGLLCLYRLQDAAEAAKRKFSFGRVRQ